MGNQILALVASVGFAGTAGAAEGALASYRQARAQLDAALRAHGGEERIAALPAVTVRFEGRRYLIGQSQAPLPPNQSEPWPIATMFDLAGGRIVQEQENRFPGGFLFRYRLVVTDKTAFELNLDKTFEGPMVNRWPGENLAGTRAVLARELPLTLLRHVATRAASLRSTAGGTVLADADGTQLTLRFDPRTHLLVGYETLGDHGLLGDHHVVVEWSEWKTERGLVVPTRLRETRSGLPSREGTLAVSFAGPAESLFAVPPEFGEGPPATPPVRKLAEGVGLIRLLDDTHTMYVELGDGILVVETPSSSAISEEAIARIEAAVPGKPIRWVTVTHAHNDHAAGLRPYIARGAMIVTTAANRGYIDAIAAAEHTVAPDRLSRAPRAPIVDVFAREKLLRGGGRSVRLISVGKTAHADDTLVIYLPAEQILYQGDMLILPKAGTGVAPGTELTQVLERLVREKKLAVKQVVGTHGRIGTMDDVHRALRQASR